MSSQEQANVPEGGAGQLHRIGPAPSQRDQKQANVREGGAGYPGAE